MKKIIIAFILIQTAEQITCQTDTLYINKDSLELLIQSHLIENTTVYADTSILNDYIEFYSLISDSLWQYEGYTNGILDNSGGLIFHNDSLLLHGTFIRIYINGETALSQFKYGLPAGTCYYLYPSGNVRTVAEYFEGNLEGWNIAYYENGHLKRIGKMTHNKKIGVWCTYHENGKLASKGDYLSLTDSTFFSKNYIIDELDGGNGFVFVKIGIWNHYDATGKLIEKKDFSCNER